MGEFRVVRNTDRFADACHFYGEVLSWPLTKQWDEPSKGRIFGYGDAARVELLDHAAGSLEPTSGVFVSIEVDDVEALHASMAANDVTVTQPLADQPWGHRSFGVTDPTGLPLVFFEVIG